MFVQYFDGPNDAAAASPIVIALRAVSQKYILSFLPTFGWSEAIKIQGPVALSFFFRHSNRRPKRRVNVLPTRSSPAASPIKLPPCRRHHRSVNCCVDPTSGGYPRPVLRPSLIFRWAPFRCPKQGNPQQRARTRARAGRLCLNGCDVVVVKILVLRLFFPRQIVRVRSSINAPPPKNVGRLISEYVDRLRFIR